MKGIRLAVVKDCGNYIEDIVRIYDQNKKEKGGLFPNNYDPISGCFSPDNHLTVCALKEEKLVGYCVLRQSKGDSPVIYINVLAVDENYRGRGIGEMLLNFVKHHSKGFSYLYSDAMIKNIPSVNLHLKLGFRKRCENGVIDLDDFGKAVFSFYEIDTSKVEDNKVLEEGENIEM